MADRILIVEDDADLRRLTAAGLREEGFEVIEARDGAGAVRAAAKGADALVLDIGLPDADGRDVCQALRAQGVDAPVLFLTARDAVTDRVSGFSAGGDDYLTKPFALAELVARIRALLRRAVPAEPPTTGGLRLDAAAHALITEDGGRVDLTPTEFRILGAVAAAAGEVVRRREMVAAGWPDGAIVHDNTLDVYVARLRRRLREAGSERRLETVHGVGYRLA